MYHSKHGMHYMKTWSIDEANGDVPLINSQSNKPVLVNMTIWSFDPRKGRGNIWLGFDFCLYRPHNQNNHSQDKLDRWTWRINGQAFNKLGHPFYLTLRLLAFKFNLRDVAPLFSPSKNLRPAKRLTWQIIETGSVDQVITTTTQNSGWRGNAPQTKL